MNSEHPNTPTPLSKDLQCIHRVGCPKPNVCRQAGHCTSMTETDLKLDPNRQWEADLEDRQAAARTSKPRTREAFVERHEREPRIGSDRDDGWLDGYREAMNEMRPVETTERHPNLVDRLKRINAINADPTRSDPEIEKLTECGNFIASDEYCELLIGHEGRCGLLAGDPRSPLEPT